MTSPLPDQPPPPVETRRQIAERIVMDACNNRSIKQVNAFVKEDYQRLADTIESALRDRDERAAKIADDNGCGEAEENCCCSSEIARAIREGK